MKKISSRFAHSIVVGLLMMTAFHSPAHAGELAVVSVSPVARSLTAPVNAAIAFTFDKPVKPESIVPLGSFWAFGRWSGTVTGAFSFSNGDQTVTLTPDRPFTAGEIVMVILSHDVEATDGTKLRPGGYSYQFWTKPKPATMEWRHVATMTTRTVQGQSSRAYGGFASDLDVDGFLDITIVNEDTADLRVFMNKDDRTGMFHPFIQPTFPVADRASPSEPSDFDRDGIVDVTVANIDDNTVSVLLGNGDGTFAPQQLIPVGGAPRGVAVLDVDGDGDTDIVNTNFGANNLSLMLNNGTGFFAAPMFFEGGGSGEWALAAGDMTNDGLLDLVIGAQGSRRIIVNANDGDGTFTPMPSQDSDGNVWMLVLGDTDADGAEDVAVVNSSSNRAAILFGDGAGNLSPPVRYSTDPFPLATDLGDLDGDGDLDWVTSSFSGDWSVYLNNGLGTFNFDGELASPIAASCSLLLDFDNDGDLDLALIDEIADVVVLMRNGFCTATEKFADIVAPFGGASQPNFLDISGVVDCFRQVPTAPFVAFCDLFPCDPVLDECIGNGVVNFQDITRAVDAFRGFGCI